MRGVLIEAGGALAMRSLSRPYEPGGATNCPTNQCSRKRERFTFLTAPKDHLTLSVRLESAPLARLGLVLSRLPPAPTAHLQPLSPLHPPLPTTHLPQQRSLKTHSSSHPATPAAHFLTALSKLRRDRPFSHFIELIYRRTSDRDLTSHRLAKQLGWASCFPNSDSWPRHARAFSTSVAICTNSTLGRTP